jgi:hypothetical protein
LAFIGLLNFAAVELQRLISSWHRIADASRDNREPGLIAEEGEVMMEADVRTVEQQFERRV